MVHPELPEFSKKTMKNNLQKKRQFLVAFALTHKHLLNLILIPVTALRAKLNAHNATKNTQCFYLNSINNSVPKEEEELIKIWNKIPSYLYSDTLPKMKRGKKKSLEWSAYMKWWGLFFMQGHKKDKEIMKKWCQTEMSYLFSTAWISFPSWLSS